MAGQRNEIRQEFAALLTNGLTGDGKPLQVVYGYRVGDFGGQSPVAVVASGGTEFTPGTIRDYRAGHYLNLYLFVLYAALDADGNLVKGANGEPVWDEADAEAALDVISEIVADLVQKYQRGQNWKSVEFAGKSEEPTVVPVGGKAYLREIYSLKFNVF